MQSALDFMVKTQTCPKCGYLHSLIERCPPSIEELRRAEILLQALQQMKREREEEK